MNPQQLKNIIEAALLTAGQPLTLARLQALFNEDEQPDTDQLRQVLDELQQDYDGRGIELKQVSSGYRIQASQTMSPWLNRLSEDKPARYSRALLETLALVAYRQPITRAGIEDIRGVSVSSSIIKTLLEREWIRVVGHRDVPGRPALYGTTRQFLDYFNLQSLSELPPLAEMRSIEDIQNEFDLNFNQHETGDAAAEAEGLDQQAATGPAAAAQDAQTATPDASTDRASPAAAAKREGDAVPVSGQARPVATDDRDADDSDTEDSDDAGEASGARVLTATSTG